MTGVQTCALPISDIGNPPLREPIIDGGEGTPEYIIIGPEFTTKEERKKLDMVQSSL